jgi:hypothetical protein
VYVNTSLPLEISRVTNRIAGNHEADLQHAAELAQVGSEGDRP